MSFIPKYEVVESRCWVNSSTGATASLYGSIPWTSEDDKANWSVVVKGYTIQNNQTGVIGGGRVPWKTREEAEAWIRQWDKPKGN